MYFSEACLPHLCIFMLLLLCLEGDSQTPPFLPAFFLAPKSCCLHSDPYSYHVKKYSTASSFEKSIFFSFLVEVL